MKSLLFISTLLFLSVALWGQDAQEQEPQPIIHSLHSPGDVSISLSGNTLLNNPYESVFSGGFKMKIFVGKRISFDADMLVGKDYTHFGPGIIGLPLSLLFLGPHLFASGNKLSGGGGMFVLIMMILSAEHIAYHFPVKGNIDISSFVSFLRFKQLNIAEQEDNYSHTSFVAGLELNQYFKRFVLSPYVEYNIAYDGYMKGFNVGLNLGYYFPAIK